MKEVRCASIPGRRNLACAPVARRFCGFSSSFRVARPGAPHASPESTRTAAGNAIAGATMGAGGCSAERRRIVYSANTHRQRACCCRRACSRMLYLFRTDFAREVRQEAYVSPTLPTFHHREQPHGPIKLLFCENLLLCPRRWPWGVLNTALFDRTRRRTSGALDTPRRSA